MKENFIKHKYWKYFFHIPRFPFPAPQFRQNAIPRNERRQSKKNKIEILCQKNLQSEKDVSAQEKKFGADILKVAANAENDFAIYWRKFGPHNSIWNY